MASPARQIESKALKLPARERARLAERLISSLDDEVDPDAKAAWARAAERRLDELRTGKVKGRFCCERLPQGARHTSVKRVALAVMSDLT